MGHYFENHLSMFATTGWQTEHTLNAIVRKYVGSNPPHPVTYRAYSRRGILRVRDYRYQADFNEFFPNAKNEQFVYAWAKYWSDAPVTFMADVSCFGPMVVYLNGQTIFKSDIFTERYVDKRHRIQLPLQAGWNHFIMRFKKTRGGFGGVFGTWLGKHPYYFVMPTPEREGGGGQQEGWIFTEPMDGELRTLPGPGMSEKDTGLRWLPERHWNATDLARGNFGRIFGIAGGTQAVGWTSARFLKPGKGQYRLTGTHDGPVRIVINDVEVYASTRGGTINTQIAVACGRHPVMVVAEAPAKAPWNVALRLAESPGTEVALESPCALVGIDDPWIYIGPISAGKAPALKALRNLDRVQPAVGGDTYWRVDMPAGWLRPYNENALYGRWNYPLGVTLYGLLHAARVIGSAEVQQYIVDHMQSCCDTLNYALWDRDQYGGATAMHTLLSSIDSLDDCGSFGSAMLEVHKHFPLKGARRIADYVADYITHKQARLEDGTFYRRILMHIFHENTMWADDLYMSVPFLCRYAALTGDSDYLDDAARQFIGFRKRLYLPELKVMSHVYDFRRDMATGVPWGRANGWTIFSLSELLAVLPAKHPLHQELLAFFRDLCEGYLGLQDPAGMWHQVINRHDTYPETSCTAMFAYAFARGVRLGLLEHPEAYARSVLRAWEALNRISIDKFANVHGVCRGSEFSFTPEYYKHDLLPNLNDTHGIGIVLLAGVETIRMMEHMRNSQTPPPSARSCPGQAERNGGFATHPRASWVTREQKCGESNGDCRAGAPSSLCHCRAAASLSAKAICRYS